MISAAISPLSMIIGCLCAGTFIDWYGRKTGHIVLAVISIISWIIQAFANNNTILLIGRFIAGVSVGSNRPITLVYLGEITDPKYRSLTLCAPSISTSLGVLISHILGGYVFWKTCCFIYAGVNFICLILLLFLKESPLWLISKGKITKGVRAFEWFRGKGVEAGKELELVLHKQCEKSEQFFIKDILTLEFGKPFLTMILLCIAIQSNGTNLFNFYAQELIAKTFKGEIDSFIGMIILDIIRLLTILAIFCFSKIVPRKMFLQLFCFSCSISLFFLSAYLYMNVSKYHWLPIVIVVLYISFGGGVVSLAWSFVPEIFPAHLRGISSGIAASISFFLLFIYVKITPGLITSYGEAILYTSFGTVTVINTILLSFILPETNGRTLQDIEDSYKKNKMIVSTL